MTRLPYGLLKQISGKTDISTQELSDYAATRKRPGRARAMVLEKATDVPASMWLFGDSVEIKKRLVEAARVK